MFAKIECGSHDSPSVEGYPPAPGPRKLGDQAMSVETAEDTAHLGAGLFPILTNGTQMLRRLKLGPDIAIGETSQAVFSAIRGRCAQKPYPAARFRCKMHP